MRIDHDGLAKRLLTAFLREFLELFLPDVLPYTDLSSVTFLDKELPRANPKSKKRAADLVAQVKFRGQDAFFLSLSHRTARRATRPLRPKDAPLLRPPVGQI